MARNDPNYRLFFSYPKMVEDLLKGFLHEDWVSRLDFSTLERVNGSFVGDELEDRRNDVIWRLRWRGEGEGWFYVYLLLEFQSTPEPFMAVRMLAYVGLLLQELIRTQHLKAGDPLPPVLSVVLYNGRRPWKAPVELSSLFGPVPEDLRRWLPRLEYLLVDENRLRPGEREQAGNLVSALARLETSRDAGEFSQSARDLALLLPGEEHRELRRILGRWAAQIMRRLFRGVTIPGVEDLEEVAMLEETFKEWERRARNVGRLEGTRQTLLRQMRRRFGRVPRRVQEQVNAISSLRELEKITDKILTAGSLQELGLG
jgi:predicted transposase YdaD